MISRFMLCGWVTCVVGVSPLVLPAPSYNVAEQEEKGWALKRANEETKLRETGQAMARVQGKIELYMRVLGESDRDLKNLRDEQKDYERNRSALLTAVSARANATPMMTSTMAGSVCGLRDKETKVSEVTKDFDRLIGVCEGKQRGLEEQIRRDRTILSELEREKMMLTNRWEEQDRCRAVFAEEEDKAKKAVRASKLCC